MILEVAKEVAPEHGVFLLLPEDAWEVKALHHWAKSTGTCQAGECFTIKYVEPEEEGLDYGDEEEHYGACTRNKELAASVLLGASVSFLIQKRGRIWRALTRWWQCPSGRGSTVTSAPDAVTSDAKPAENDGNGAPTDQAPATADSITDAEAETTVAAIAKAAALPQFEAATAASQPPGELAAATEAVPVQEAAAGKPAIDEAEEQGDGSSRMTGRSSWMDSSEDEE